MEAPATTPQDQSSQAQKDCKAIYCSDTADHGKRQGAGLVLQTNR